MTLLPSKPFRVIVQGLLVALALLVAGCGGSNYYKDDRPPSGEHDVSAIPDAVPRIEPTTLAGNKNPYTVLGKTYHLLPSNKGYRERGIASWYGTRFHGKKTSNGETYDMFAMSAAHKTLRIPAYVRVTNIDNGRQVIVRVNDRGPFLHDRLIDLSYAAAKKLGYAEKGIARVEVEAIDPVAYQQAQQSQPATRRDAKPLEKGPYMQLAAFSTSRSALQLQARVRKYTQRPVLVMISKVASDLLYKVVVGPMTDTAEQEQLRELLKSKEKISPFLIHY